MQIEEIYNLNAGNLLRLIQENIKRNSENIQSLKMKMELHRKGISNIRQHESMYSISEKIKLLSEENKYYIELHARLLSYIKSLATEMNATRNNKPAAKPAVRNVTEEYFLKTIRGEINFDKGHPLFLNRNFRSRLYEYYIQHEDYENCASLTNKPFRR